MKNRERIAIFISFSGEGGVERMMNNLAAGFLDAGVKVDMVIARAQGEHLSSIPDGVHQVRLRSRHTLTALPGLTRYLRKEKPAVLLAVKDRAIKTAVIARWISGSQAMLIGRIGTTVSAALKDRGTLRRWSWFAGMRLFYRQVNRIIAVSRGVADDIISITRLPRERVIVVPNPVVTPLMYILAQDPVLHPWLSDSEVPVIMGAGRLTRQKDFKTLVRAFALVRGKRECRLIILGEGEQREELSSLGASLGVLEHLCLPGFVANPYKWIARCSVFALSSLWEGSPNTLTEALALGIPVVSTDCRSGPGEILQGGRYGSLVPVGEVRELADAIIRTLEDPLPRETLTMAVKKFTVQESVRGYLEVLKLHDQLT